jgi:DNA-binding NtrC family response regulator
MNKILLIDDKENILLVFKVILEKEGYKVETASTGREGLKLAVQIIPDIIISDIQMNDLSGTEIFHLLKSRGFDIPFIFITAYASVEEAVSAIQDGAVDYLTKPVDHDRLKKIIARLIKNNKSGIKTDKSLIGSSQLMKDLYTRIKAVASSNSTILISGKSGTGKELISRAIHNQSSRKEGPFIPVNCSAFSMSLLESELFGYEKGAFTGADKQKTGFLETAQRGTLFLDEISELDPIIQVKLLRVLQERVFTRVGGTSFINLDVRLIAATNKNLDELVDKHLFRHDLYYRLNVIPIKAPALRDHPEDIGELVKTFSETLCALEQMTVPEITPGFLNALKMYTWPGNVRELENLIERMLIIHRPDKLEESLLFEESKFFSKGLNRSLTERERIVNALILCGGNKTEGSKILAMPRRTLYHKISKLGIQTEEYMSV